MKLFTGPIVCGFALQLIASSSAAPSSLIDGAQPLDGDFIDPTLNTTALDVISANTIGPRGYDPSSEWQGDSAVEIWSGGSNNAPVNYGDTRGLNLATIIFSLLDDACPASNAAGGAGCCPGSPKHGTPWQSFFTNALINGDPWWTVALRKPQVRIERGCFQNEKVRVLLLRLVADTLRAYVRKSTGYNCYDIPGQWKGVYCNVPNVVRVNLPNYVQHDGPSWLRHNYMHIETWSTDARNKIGFTKGQLRPCKTRALVDTVMDSYERYIVEFFPKWKGQFKRNARVIIDGYKICSNEP